MGKLPALVRNVGRDIETQHVCTYVRILIWPSSLNVIFHGSTKLQFYWVKLGVIFSNFFFIGTHLSRWQDPRPGLPGRGSDMNVRDRYHHRCPEASTYDLERWRPARARTPEIYDRWDAACKLVAMYMRPRCRYLELVGHERGAAAARRRGVSDRFRSTVMTQWPAARRNARSSRVQAWNLRLGVTPCGSCD